MTVVPEARQHALDPALPTLERALDASLAEDDLARALVGREAAVRVLDARLIRHKPGRRALIEYDIELVGGERRSFATLIGKMRAGRRPTSGLRRLEAFWTAGFDERSPDGIRVPEPIGVVEPLALWLQRKAPGIVASELIAGADGVALAERVAEAAHKVHRARVAVTRTHSLADELRILHECLPRVAAAAPRLARRIERLLAGCERLAARVPAPRPVGVHRDFYADQVIVDGDRLTLVDFDLYCVGDPALDVGNFLGHVTEQSLRTFGDPDALADREQALEERFLQLSGVHRRRAVRAYYALTLARQVYLCHAHLGRRPLVERVLELSEERLALGRGTS